MRICVAAVVLFLVSCSDETSTRRTLEGAGYSNISIEGWGLGCPEYENTCTKFSATGPTGKRVKGAVGCGFLKGCTIRVD